MNDYREDPILHREIGNLKQLFTMSIEASDKLTARRFSGVEEQLGEIKATLGTFATVKDTVTRLEATKQGATELKKSIYSMGTLIIAALGLVATRL